MGRSSGKFKKMLFAVLVCCLSFCIMTGSAGAVFTPEGMDGAVAAAESAAVDTVRSILTGIAELLAAQLPPAGISLIGGEEYALPCGTAYVEPGFVAYNSAGEDISAAVTVEGSVCCWKTGSYALSYSVTDPAGGESYTAVRLVNVVPAELPETVLREKTIYLTFDDGPCQYTEKVLDILDKYDVKATFFIVAKEGLPYQDMMGEIAARGHTLGIHCSDHEYSRLYSSEEYFFEDFMKAQAILHEKTGLYAVVSRFPGGSDTAMNFLGHRTQGGFDTIKQRLADMGIRYYDWNVKTEGTDRSGEDMMHFFVTDVPKYETPISLQHDTRLYSVNMLERFLQWGLDNGYSFAPIDSTTPEVHFR